MTNDDASNKTTAPKIVSFTDLHAWKRGYSLVIRLYQETRTFSHDERYGLTSQMRRSAVSVTSNIAEGFSRRSYREKGQFYHMALGSLTELQNHLMVSKDLGYISERTYRELREESIVTHKLLNGLIKHTRAILQHS